ncbi:MAG: CBS domain-containing protein [Planctomycetes bacterium]|nr:CBS domain-containing protein [Planctomycetota bacterium]
MKIEKCMTWNPFFLKSGTPIREAAKVFIARKFGALPILDKRDKLIGIVTIMDLLKVFLPDFVPLVDIDFIKDYGALEIQEKDVEKIESLVVDDIMTKKVVSVDSDCPLTRAISLMKKHDFRHLPVVKGGKLIGMVSSTDICRRFRQQGFTFG